MGVLNFSTNNLITGVNIIDENLYWTDDLNEPKKLEIDRFRDYTQVENTAIRGEFFNESDISVIRPHPHIGITLVTEEYEPTATQPNSPFEEIFPRFSYRWRYEDGQYSPYAPFTEAAFISKTRTNGVDATRVLAVDTDANTITVDSETGITGDNPGFVLGDAYLENGDVIEIIRIIPTAVGEESNVFEVSNTNGFLDGANILRVDPAPTLRQFSTVETNYVQGFNTTMFNNVGSITLDNIPRGPRDVVEIDLLYTESISATIYVLETIEIPQAQRGLDYVLSGSYVGGVPTDDDYDLLPLRYELSARKVYRALPETQLIRPYDDVPRAAKAQEITANRLVYGNYLKNYDQPNNVRLDAELVSAGAGDGLHVKGNRTYEIGVVYIDPYGRQGGMIQAGSITAADGMITEQAPLLSDFNQDTREQIQATILSDPPIWADTYRYYIKDTSQDHHNLIGHNVYNEGSQDEVDSQFVWVEFLSADRNKLEEGSIIVLRRHNNNIPTERVRFLVQDIENEAPEDVRSQLQLSASSQNSRVLGTAANNTWDVATNQRLGDSPTRAQLATNLVIDAQGGETLDVIKSLFNTYLSRQVTPNTGEPLAILDAETATLNNLPVGGGERLLARWVDPGNGNGTSGHFTDEWVTITTLNHITGDAFTPLQITFGDRVRIIEDEPQVVYINANNPDDTQARTVETLEVGAVTSFRTFGSEFGINDFAETYDEWIARTSQTGGGIGLANPHTGTNLYSATVGTRDYSGLNLELATDNLNEEVLERLQGRFWARVARQTLPTSISRFTNDGRLISLESLWFETEPQVEASQLDLFWESNDSFCIRTEHGWPNRIDWYNAIAEVDANGVYLESQRVFDRFNSVQLVKGVRVNTPQERFAEERRPYGLTWSGIYNSRTGINRLNQFILAEGITKELEPNYGSLQKLHTRDTNIIAFCEDKIFRILADKDQLFNADGGGNVSATNAVLGQTTPFVGEYGISKNPESFASYGHNIYCSDAKRGVVLQITPGNGQIFEISNSGLNDFFRDRLFSADRVIGMFDDYSDKYVISIQGYDGTDAIIDPLDRIPGEGTTSDNVTWGYEIRSEGWPSRMSFIPEDGLTLNNRFFTWKNGQLYMHNSNTVDRNVFYGEDAVASEIEVIFNDNPSAVKEFLTIGYEGTEGWELLSTDTEDSEEINMQSIEFPFVPKEGKYFKPLVFTEPVYEYQGGVIVDSGRTQEKSGIKGFYNVVRLQNNSTTSAELFAVNTENYISSN